MVLVDLFCVTNGVARSQTFLIDVGVQEASEVNNQPGRQTIHLTRKSRSELTQPPVTAHEGILTPNEVSNDRAVAARTEAGRRKSCTRKRLNLLH